MQPFGINGFAFCREVLPYGLLRGSLTSLHSYYKSFCFFTTIRDPSLWNVLVLSDLRVAPLTRSLDIILTDSNVFPKYLRVTLEQ